MEAIIEQLKAEALKSWNGKTGEERAEQLEKYLRAKLQEYSEALGVPQDEILQAWEQKRKYSALYPYP